MKGPAVPRTAGVGFGGGSGFGDFVFGVAVGLGGVDVGRGLQLRGSFGFKDGFGLGGRDVRYCGPEIVAFELDGVGVGFVGCFQLDGVGAELFAGTGGFGCVRLHGYLLLHGIIELAGHLLELFDAGELVDVLEAEAQEEVFGGFVEDGAADDLLAAGGGDELAGEQRAEDAGGVDAADLGDFRGGDGLLVGDDGEGFEGLEGEL